MILVVTPNPAIDRTLVVPGFHTGKIYRVQQSIIAAGGKGLNAARVIKLLGGEPRCAGFLGGHSGRRLAELASQENLAATWTWITAETRTCTIIVDSDRREATVINEAGPEVTAADWDSLGTVVLRAAHNSQGVCWSGSLPPGSPVDRFSSLLKNLMDKRIPVWVDTSGPALEAALSAGPLKVKVNGEEAASVTGIQVMDLETGQLAAVQLLKQGLKQVVLTLGPAGAVMASPEGVWWAHPPEVQAVSPVGSGDAFLAGLVVAQTSGQPIAEALRSAVAAGAANTLEPGGGRFQLRDFEAIYERTQVTRLSNSG